MAVLKFYGASQIVTGSCYLLESNGFKILIDCGMFQGSKAIKEKNYGDFPFAPNEIDFLILTHAHIDHSGLIPKLFKKGFQGYVYTTKATAKLAEVMLPDSGHIQEMEVERKNRKYRRAGKPLIEPIYTAEEAQNCIKYFRSFNYNEKIDLASNIQLYFHDAGHILGSAIAELFVKENNKDFKIVFSGDIGNTNQPIINDPTVILEADYVVMESTYGNRLHQDIDNKLEKLAAIVKETMQKGGNLIIPSFAVERTQDILYDLNLLIQNGDIPQQNVYIDSPLAIAATEIFSQSSEYFDEETKTLQSKNGGCPFSLPGLKYARTTEESIALNQVKGGAIIISASGMCDAGRIKHHLKHNLWRPESTILFVGYQAEGTLGRRLIDGEKKVTIHGEEINVKADIRRIDGFSAHADQIGLLNWATSFKNPKCYFITHGEEAAAHSFAKLLSQKVDSKVIVPKLLDEYPINMEEQFEPTLTSLEIIQAKLADLINSEIQKGNQKKVQLLLQQIKDSIDQYQDI
ncbi:MBL fold metallo-hydrolase [Bacillota bacterium LX-D]|nr:MBL fold metallo-hydrolase [Bacillota bacterium LX-D]